MRLPCRCAAAFSLSFLFACSSEPAADPSTPPALSDLSDVVYVGGPTDEALRRLLDSNAKDDATERVLLDTPEPGQPVSKEAPVTFAFHAGTQAAARPARRPLHLEKSARWRHAAADFLALIGPIRTAAAHGAPYNGLGYFLVFTGADKRSKLRVFTAQTSYTPDLTTWSTLVQSPQPLSLSITLAFFEENEVPEDGGPFVGGVFPVNLK